MLTEEEKEDNHEYFLNEQEALFDLVTEKHGGVLMENENSGGLGLRVYNLYIEGLTTNQVADRITSWVNTGSADIADTPEKRVDEALNCAFNYAGIDGAHHKDYCIDQMVRALTGDKYRQWAKDFEAGVDGPQTYCWEVGCP